MSENKYSIALTSKLTCIVKQGVEEHPFNLKVGVGAMVFVLGKTFSVGLEKYFCL